MPLGCLSLFVFLAMLFFFPLILADAMTTAMLRLGMSPQASLLAIMGIFIGGMINVPVQRIPREEAFETEPFSFMGMNRFFRRDGPRQACTVIAVNIGGCVIPGLVAVYELLQLAAVSPALLTTGLTGVGLSTLLCYHLARPVPGVGIAMPPLIPALAAAMFGLFAGGPYAPPVAFAAGVLGPLIGADILHLKDISRISTGMASIGGAGTFDGIVISGLFAALLA